MGHIHNTYEYDPEDARIAAWFLTGLRHETIRLAKKKKNLRQRELLILNETVTNYAGRQISEMIDTISDEVDTLSKAEESVFIQDTLSVLTKHQKAVIKATILEDATEEQVAKELGVSQPAINMMKKRALDKLKKHLS